jgi:hypothetical protein
MVTNDPNLLGLCRARRGPELRVRARRQPELASCCVFGTFSRTMTHEDRNDETGENFMQV